MAPDTVAATVTTTMTAAAAADGANQPGQRRPGPGGESGRRCALPAARGDGSPVPAVTFPDDIGRGQWPGLPGGVIGQLPQFVVQARHWNTSRLVTRVPERAFPAGKA